MSENVHQPISDTPGLIGEGQPSSMLVKLAEQVASCAPAACGAVATLSIDGVDDIGGVADSGVGVGVGGEMVDADGERAGGEGWPSPGGIGVSGGTGGVGGTGGGPGGPEPAAGVTHPDLAPLVAVQWSSGDGPIPRAISTGEPAAADDLLAEKRWPAYRALALDAGVRSSATLPFRHDGVTVTVTVYGFRPGVMDDRTRTATTLVGSLAAHTMLRDHRCEQALTQADQLDSAMRSRPVVDQASGIIMYVLGCDADAAFQLLLRQSQRSNSKLLDVASQVVATRGRDLAAAAPAARGRAGAR